MGLEQQDTSPSVPFTTMISVSHCSQRSRVPGAVAMGRRLPNPVGFESSRVPLAAADRARCGPVAPPDGLFLMRVEY